MSEEDEGWSDWMVWCDLHTAFHEAQAIQDTEEGPPCGSFDWRRVFIEPRWAKEPQWAKECRESGGALPGSALIPPPGYKKE